MEKQYSIPTPNLRFQHLTKQPVAFFSAEYALEDEFPIYAGGLGVLAGDFLLEAGEQGLPIVAVGLVYRRGFETFAFGANNPALPDPEKVGFALLRRDNQKPLLLEIELGQRMVLAQVWRRAYGTVHLFLLDTDVDQNSSADRTLTDFLYPKDFQTKLLQEIIFGIGAVKLFRKLNITPSIYHLNESHTAFVILALVVEYLHDHPGLSSFTAALEQVKPEIVATKHTILPVTGLFFSRTDFQGILDVYLARHNLSFEDFCEIGSWEKEPQFFSMTKFLLQSAVRANAVSKLHAKFETQTHPHSQLFPITNAVNLKHWLAPQLEERNLRQLSDQQLWHIHGTHRQAITEYASNQTGTKLNPQALTVVWARRFAAYKRPTLLFADLKRLLRLVSDSTRPVQFIFSGQPNVSDAEGIVLLKQILQYTQNANFIGKLVWLPNYSLPLARKLVWGADVWLNTPELGREASGTSGMKSAVNGGLQLSTSDGWIDEIDWSGRGWILPEINTKDRVYNILETEIVPLFYDRDEAGLPRKWIKNMRDSMTFVQKEYSTKRMLEEYLTKLYFPNL